MLKNVPGTSWRLLLVASLLFLLSGCATRVGRDDFFGSRERGETVTVVIDVRTKSEYDRGHIPGAVHLPVLSLPFHLDRIPVSGRDEEVTVYCAHGPRAGLAGFFLVLAGFSNVRHLQGDFVGWQKAGYPVEKGVGKR